MRQEISKGPQMSDAVPVPVPDPTIYRRRLRNELRKAREAAGFAQRDVAAEMDWSLSKLLRIETGAVSITTNDLKALLTHYRITDAARVQSLLDIARAARERSPWNAYKDLGPPEFISHLAYESAASVVRNFEPLLVPGLLQTEEYAREVLSEVRGPDKRTVDRLVDLRMERQEILDRENPPSLHVIMDEAVINRAVGGVEAMSRQLRRIKEVAARPNVTVRVLPFSAGLYPRPQIPYVLFEFAEPENEDILSIEIPLGDIVIREASPEEQEDASPVTYLEVFFQLEQIARREDAMVLIDRAIARMSKDAETGGAHPAANGAPGELKEI
jgi:transcriptional regulator with XRE-family HTH domain